MKSLLSLIKVVLIDDGCQEALQTAIKACGDRSEKGSSLSCTSELLEGLRKLLERYSKGETKKPALCVLIFLVTARLCDDLSSEKGWVEEGEKYLKVLSFTLSLVTKTMNCSILEHVFGMLTSSVPVIEAASAVTPLRTLSSKCAMHCMHATAHASSKLVNSGDSVTQWLAAAEGSFASVLGIRTNDDDGNSSSSSTVMPTWCIFRVGLSALGNEQQARLAVFVLESALIVVTKCMGRVSSDTQKKTGKSRKGETPTESMLGLSRRSGQLCRRVLSLASHERQRSASFSCVRLLDIASRRVAEAAKGVQGPNAAADDTVLIASVRAFAMDMAESQVNLAVAEVEKLVVCLCIYGSAVVDEKDEQSWRSIMTLARFMCDDQHGQDVCFWRFLESFARAAWIAVTLRRVFADENEADPADHPSLSECLEDVTRSLEVMAKLPPSASSKTPLTPTLAIAWRLPIMCLPVYFNHSKSNTSSIDASLAPVSHVQRAVVELVRTLVLIGSGKAAGDSVPVAARLLPTLIISVQKRLNTGTHVRDGFSEARLLRTVVDLVVRDEVWKGSTIESQSKSDMKANNSCSWSAQRLGVLRVLGACLLALPPSTILTASSGFLEGVQDCVESACRPDLSEGVGSARDPLRSAASLALVLAGKVIAEREQSTSVMSIESSTVVATVALLARSAAGLRHVLLRTCSTVGAATMKKDGAEEVKSMGVSVQVLADARGLENKLRSALVRCLGLSGSTASAAAEACLPVLRDDVLCQTLLYALQQEVMTRRGDRTHLLAVLPALVDVGTTVAWEGRGARGGESSVRVALLATRSVLQWSQLGGIAYRTHDDRGGERTVGQSGQSASEEEEKMKAGAQALRAEVSALVAATTVDTAPEGRMVLHLLVAQWAAGLERGFTPGASAVHVFRKGVSSASRALREMTHALTAGQRVGVQTRQLAVSLALMCTRSLWHMLDAVDNTTEQVKVLAALSSMEREADVIGYGIEWTAMMIELRRCSLLRRVVSGEAQVRAVLESPVRHDKDKTVVATRRFVGAACEALSSREDAEVDSPSNAAAGAAAFVALSEETRDVLANAGAAVYSPEMLWITVITGRVLAQVFLQYQQAYGLVHRALSLCSAVTGDNVDGKRVTVAAAAWTCSSELMALRLEALLLASDLHEYTGNVSSCLNYLAEALVISGADLGRKKSDRLSTSGDAPSTAGSETDEESVVCYRDGLPLMQVVSLCAVRVWYRLGSTEFVPALRALCVATEPTTDEGVSWVESAVHGAAVAIREACSGGREGESHGKPDALSFRYLSHTWCNPLQKRGGRGSCMQGCALPPHVRTVLDASLMCNSGCGDDNNVATHSASTTLRHSFVALSGLGQDTLISASSACINVLQQSDTYQLPFDAHRALRRRAAVQLLVGNKTGAEEQQRWPQRSRGIENDSLLPFVLCAGSVQPSVECTLDSQGTRTSLHANLYAHITDIGDILAGACQGDAIQLGTIRARLGSALSDMQAVAVSIVHDVEAGSLLVSRMDNTGTTLTAALPVGSTVAALLDQWTSAMADNKAQLAATHDGAVLASWSEKEKRAWWDRRETTDEAMRGLLESFQALLGPWRCLLVAGSDWASSSSSFSSSMGSSASPSSSSSSSSLTAQFDKALTMNEHDASDDRGAAESTRVSRQDQDVLTSWAPTLDMRAALREVRAWLEEVGETMDPGGAAPQRVADAWQGAQPWLRCLLGAAAVLEVTAAEAVDGVATVLARVGEAGSEGRPLSSTHLPPMRDVATRLVATATAARVGAAPAVDATTSGREASVGESGHDWVASLKVVELRSRLKDLQLSTAGRKDELVSRLQTALASTSSSSTTNTTTATGGKKPHVILLLDEHLQGVPWESVPCLAQRQCSRIPGLALLLALSCPPPSSSGAATTAADAATSTTAMVMGSTPAPVNVTKCWYAVDPDDNLPSTRRVMTAFLEPFSQQWGWCGVVGSIPQQGDVRRLHEHSELFIYCGHGAGERLYASDRLRKVSCPSALLWGCSSGQLATRGTHDPSGAALAYMLGGASWVVGNLWDVTDRDIDRLSMSCMDSLFGHRPPSSNGRNSGSQGNTTKKARAQSSGAGADACRPLSTAEGLRRSRAVCKMARLVGCAPVMYGLPTNIIVGDEVVDDSTHF